MPDFFTVTVQSTHFYLVDAGQGKLLVDTGWSGSMPRLLTELKKAGVKPEIIRYVLATHYHPDHAGLVQEIKREWRAHLIIHDVQAAGPGELKAFHERKKDTGYLPIQIEQGDILLKNAVDYNRSALSALGIHGALVPTPGHSDDSVTLLLDGGQAFIGDLHPPAYSTEDALETICASWKKLIDLNAQWFYPAHGNPFPAEMITTQLSELE
jgi:endoribonuclease LACTB2